MARVRDASLEVRDFITYHNIVSVTPDPGERGHNGICIIANLRRQLSKYSNGYHDKRRVVVRTPQYRAVFCVVK